MIPLADELYALLGDRFLYIAFEKSLDIERQKLGWSNLTSPYLIYFFDNLDYSKEHINNADVVYFGANPSMFKFIKERIYNGKLTFFHMERILKHGILQFFIPKYTRYYIEQRIKPSKMENVFFLGCSSYLNNDLKRIHASTTRTYNFGYFPSFDTTDFERMADSKSSNNGTFVFLIAGRMLRLKHFDRIIKAFALLKKDRKGILPNDKHESIVLRIVGGGDQEERLKQLVLQLDISDSVEFLGSLSPESVRKEMIKADSFVAASDKREGWGAVINEAMNSCCAVIASKEMGSVPFLIRDGFNGYTFHSKDVKGLSKLMVSIVNNSELRQLISKNAYLTIKDLWNQKNAAKRLLDFSNSLLNNAMISYESGPLAKSSENTTYGLSNK